MSLSGILKLMERHPEFCRSIDEAAAGAQAPPPPCGRAHGRRSSPPSPGAPPRPCWSSRPGPRTPADSTTSSSAGWARTRGTPAAGAGSPALRAAGRRRQHRQTSASPPSPHSPPPATRSTRTPPAKTATAPPWSCAQSARLLLYTAPPRTHGRRAAIREHSQHLARRRPRPPRRGADPVGADGLPPRAGGGTPPGSFSHRGGILDIYPPTASCPCASSSSTTRLTPSAASTPSRSAPSARPTRCAPSRPASIRPS